MRIVCPSCTAAYEVPDRLLGGGKKLRCARCANEWVPAEILAPAAAPPTPPPLPPAAAEPPPAVAPSPPLPLQAPPPPELILHAEPKPPRQTRPASSGVVPVLLALAASFVVLLGLVAAALSWRFE